MSTVENAKYLKIGLKQAPKTLVVNFPTICNKIRVSS